MPKTNIAKAIKTVLSLISKRDVLTKELSNKQAELNSVHKELKGYGISKGGTLGSYGGNGKKPTKAKPRKAGKRVTEAQVLAAIKQPASIGDVAAKLKISPLTASTKLKALKKADKASSKKSGVKVLYSAK